MDKERYEKWKRGQAIKRMVENKLVKGLIRRAPKDTNVRTVSGGLPSLGKKK